MRAFFAAFLAALVLLYSGPVQAQSSASPAPVSASTATISGLVVDRQSALPISGATVEARNATAVAGSATTAGDGRFTLSLPPAIYTITIRAGGYQSVANADLALAAGTATTLDVSLVAASTASRTTLTTIGSASTSAHTLSAATTNTRVVDLPDLTATGQIRIGDALGHLPATNFSTSSSVGDDASINLRGFGSDETSSLLDGHPVGPLGIGSGGFNFSLGPAFGLSELDVTYGSGAQGLFGSDTVGGAINYVTLTPTATPHFSFQQQIGGFGLLSTGATATGTFNKLGYAFALGRLGEYGDFAPRQIAQSARPNNVGGNSVMPNAAPCPGGYDTTVGAAQTPVYDISPCNLALNTYTVSQNTEQTVGLAKLDYAFSSATHFRATAYGAVQWSDSTGNGDNDFLPYSTRLKQITGSTPNCTLPGGGGGYLVSVDPAAGQSQCDSAQQFAAASSGPDGGGEARQRSTTMRDYDFSFSTRAGLHTITLTGFDNNYEYWKYSTLAGGIDAFGQAVTGPTFADYYNTQGYAIGDEIVTPDNILGFGYTLYHQQQNSLQVDNNVGIGSQFPLQYFSEGSVYLRDSHHFNDRFSAFLNAWVKRSSVTGRTTFDPRFTAQYHPTNHDIVQFTYGHSDGAPSPQLKVQGAVTATDPGASLTTVDCGGDNSVTSAGDPNLKAESADDFEAGLGHRFNADSNIQLNGYVTTESGRIFSADQPLTQYGVNNVQFAPGALQTYLARLQTQCPGSNITLANIYNYLAVSTTYNASSALVRGLELSGRARFTPQLYLDAGYFVESSTLTGVSPIVLASNSRIVNGSQIAGVPLHQATISLDFAPGAWELHLDNYYVGPNNPLNRPSYWHSDAFVTRNLGHGTTLTLGGTNIFNSAVQDYGYIGLGTIYATNPYGSAPRASEEFGIAPAQATLTLQQRI